MWSDSSRPVNVFDTMAGHELIHISEWEFLNRT